MKTHQLRTLRVILGGLFFISAFLVFVDFRSLIPSKFTQLLLSFQFLPSAMKYYDLRTLAAAGFVAVMILTLFTGRTYCSFFCPLGIGQDIFSWIGGKFRKRFRRYGYKRPHTFLRYSILAGLVVVTMVWGIYMLTLLDPFSIFGRFMTFFMKPVVILVNNSLANLLGKFDIYTLSHTSVRPFSLVMYTIPTAFFLLVGVMSFTKGRFYCNVVCPVGTLLGLISKVSILRIKIDESACTRCGRCSMRCKSSCIDFLRRDVDVSRCVGCFNCINNCQDDAISYGLVRIARKEHKTDESRRAAIVASMMLLFGISSVTRAQDKKAPVPKNASTVKEEKDFPVCPPGAVSIREFNKKCTACSLCINACPNGVLQPAYKEYGLSGMMQPVMNYHKSFCTYKCTVCTEICPTYALKPLILEAKQLTQLGKARFIKDNCIVETEKTACGACSEACPTKAVYMVPFEGNLLIPEVNPDICIGCGHCEFACPTNPYKAIYVNGNAIHAAAAKPENEKADMKSPTEFPF